VRNNWYRVIPESDQTKKGKLAIEFAITKDGKIAGMKVVEPSGEVSLDRAAWRGITKSNPFRPLPYGFSGPYRFAFPIFLQPRSFDDVSAQLNQLTITAISLPRPFFWGSARGSAEGAGGG
jgi:TonB family protein